MLKDSHDRKTCDGNLFFVLLVASGLASALGCGLGDGDKADGAEVGDGALLAGGPMGAAPNGVAFPVGVQDWRPIGAVARRDDGGSVRVIVGNDTAVNAARSGQTNPWPEGTMLSHFVWEAERNPDDGATVGPGAFKAITLMQKNSTKYAADGGWAYGLWAGEQLTPPADANFDRDCVGCHTAEVADKDYVFTVPGQLPDAAALAAAPDAPNGVAFPDKILDWRVLGVASIQPAMGAGTLRLLVGNNTAVEAARSGDTNPWPDGSMISHYQWAAGTNPETASVVDAVSPGDFLRFTVIQRSTARYEADGDWAYGAWNAMALMPPPAAVPPAAEFDRACVACHTTNVADRDMIFTRVGELPDMMLTPTTIAR